MTIDNHPLTPKPVDDREAGVGYHQVLPVDEQLALWMLGALDYTAAAGAYAQILQMIARHREQAEREASELLSRALVDTFRLVDGEGFYVPKTLTSKTVRDIQAFLNRKTLETRL